MKMKATIWFMILITIIGLGGCQLMNKEIEEDVKSYELNSDEYYFYSSFYRLDCNQSINMIDLEKELVFTAGERALEYIELMNYTIFESEGDDFFTKEGIDALRIVATAYGFDKDDPITAEWVIDNPREALDMVQSDWNFQALSDGYDRRRVRDYQNSIESDNQQPETQPTKR